MALKIPYHITGLLIFVCTCQILLLYQINSGNFMREKYTILKNVRNTYSEAMIDLKHHAVNRDLLAASDENLENGGPMILISSEQLFTNLSKEYNLDRFAHVSQKNEYLSNTTYGDKYNHANDYYRIHTDISVPVLRNPAFMCNTTEDGNIKISLIVLVHSSVENIERRDAIRNTWGQISRDFDRDRQVRVIFVIGLKKEDPSGDTGYEYIEENVDYMDHVYKESKLYRDVLLGDFVDSYTNLTLKSLFGLHWVLRNCVRSKYILKTDDDVFMHIPLILKEFPSINSSCDIIGSLNTDAKVERNGLWGISPDLYPKSTYPPYVSGCAYLISTISMHKMLEKLFPSHSVLHLEDVYISGILAPSVNNSVCHHRMFPYWIQGPSRQNMDILEQEQIFGLHNVQFEDMYDIHKKVSHRHKQVTEIDLEKLKSIINSLKTNV